MSEPLTNVLLGKWTYRSFLSNPDPSVPFNDLEFGVGTIRIDPSATNEFKGLIYGPGWELTLKGSTTWGNPFEVRFQGKGVVSGAEWIYDYIGYVVKPWPNGVNQRPAIVGSIVRTIPHPTGQDGNSTAPAGVVAQWIAVKRDEDAP
jgi:hypothetical protein